MAKICKIRHRCKIIHYLCTDERSIYLQVKKMMTTGPTAERERHLILDVLRGLALMGIALANFPEFALWTFLSGDEQAAMATASTDRVVRYWQYVLVDGKFYTIFSLLFGVGFSLILVRHGRRLFLRRMLVLVLIGFLHLMFIWSGDILLLYAVGGLLLTVFVGFNDRLLLTVAMGLIVLPVGLDALTEWGGVDFAGPFYDHWWQVATAQGITEANFASWLHDADSYGQMFAFLLQGACERLWEFVDSHRLPKVLGLFIVGYLIGKHRLYARLTELPLLKTFLWTLAVGLPTSLVYAWSATQGHPLGQTMHALLYAVSIIPLAVAYVAGLCLLYLRGRDWPLWQWIAAPGRIALSNYISQSIIGVVLFYGIGFGLGTTVGLSTVEIAAFGVFLLQILCSRQWLLRFRFGPLEWLWRIATYGRYFPITTGKNR